MARRSLDLVKHVKFLAQAGAITKPKWLDVVEKIHPAVPAKSSKKPAVLRFPEDDLLQAYYAKHPEAKMEPVDLSSFEPTSARKFVFRQLEVMQTGVPRKEAYDIVSKEVAEAASTSDAPALGRVVLDQIQQEEEWHLMNAMSQFRERHPTVAKLSPKKPPPANPNPAKGNARRPPKKAPRPTPAPPAQSMPA
ncbi:hypothetical protein F751_0156 [Auxenochlorella protothecoides]|uniref:Small ribosomal subunit protein mS23 n=1 Tax=Auxenochlorella protothecoides TaxID=3075 RepID=A0A087S9K5_AUXPR|nr:hypothetical protein F751_0156 [Auxenochlorella protothecoides]KFM22409.1 hypothetical protein F751_0156 [Auxenochlorella protothecoides]RMZ55496.1 hypothetical protein APUTEX25_000079 [Auxenochlorella protothecoides]|eukprot:RMZ55496.1 hypothetical protein APUTEX25_000079 [Auxenochlorella protothecoides]